MSEPESGLDRNERVWMHRRNIERYGALLANPAKRDSHEQVRRLLAEEEEKLRVLGGG